MFVPLAFAVAFIIVGIFFFLGKGAFLMAGYNTMTAEQRAAFNEKRMLRTMAVLMWFTALTLITLAIGEAIKSHMLIWISIICMIVFPIIITVYMNTSKRMRNF